MIEFDCPHCDNSIRVSDAAAGKNGQCKSCGRMITVPSGSVLLASPSPPPISRRPKRETLSTNVGVPRTSEQTSNIAVQVNVAAPSQLSNSMGIGSVILGILALMVCWMPLIGILGAPLGLLGVALGSVSVFLAVCRKGSGLGFGIAGGSISALALLICFVINSVIFAGASEVAKQVQEAERRAQAKNAGRFAAPPAIPRAVAAAKPKVVSPTPKPQPVVVAPPADPWADVGTTAADKLVKVEIASVKIGKVELESIGSDGESEDDLLQIRLSILNLSDAKKLNYRGWGARDFGFGNSAALMDEHGNRYTKCNFGISKVKGQLASESIYPEKSVNDVLVFELPVEKAKFLYLTLPTSVYAASSSSETVKELKIKIPTSSIER